MDAPIELRPLVAIAAIWLLAMAALARPMFRDHGDDQGDGMSLVLLPPPVLPRFRRTLAFALTFLALSVLYHSVDGPWGADRLYRSALAETVSKGVASRAEALEQLSGFTLGLRALVLAAMLSLAMTCRATPMRRCCMVVQTMWYVVAIFAFDALLLTIGLTTGAGATPGTVVGNWFAIGIGFVGISRLLYANFALPKPTALPLQPRTGLPGTALLAITLVAMCLSATLLVLAYHASTADLRPVLAVVAPFPFSVGTYAARVALLGVVALLFLREPAVGGARPPLDVIIPAYNEQDVVEDTLLAIDAAAARYGGPVRVILTDDGSTDETRQVAERAFSGFTAARGQIVDGEHKGKSAALNLALAETDTDIVVRIDADTLIADDALLHLPRWFRDERIGLVEALMWPRWENTPYHRMRLFEELRIFGMNHRVFQTVDAINVVPGVFTAFRRAPAVELGGFTVGMNGEDGDFTMRMARLGWRTRLDPKIVVYEGVPETFAELREQRVRWSRATIHNQARQGIYRAGRCPPMVWFTQTHQYFRRVRSPIFFVMPFYLAIYAAFQASWRVPLLVALGALLISQIAFTTFTLVLAVGYGFARHLGWVAVWPVWRWCLTMFSTESLLSLPSRPFAPRSRNLPVISDAVVH
jgi:cellulose synthase/poly-beta-1,6-N-acetylglucosamine synthase-like glycosyltransferase